MADKKMIDRASTTEVGLNELRARIAAGTRNPKATEAMLDADDIRVQVAAGVADGFALVLSDDALVNAFWRKGYTELAAHGAAGASQWVGKRLFTAMVLAIVTAGLIWLLRNGALR